MGSDLAEWVNVAACAFESRLSLSLGNDVRFIRAWRAQQEGYVGAERVTFSVTLKSREPKAKFSNKQLSGHSPPFGHPYTGIQIKFSRTENKGWKLQGRTFRGSSDRAS